MCRLPHASRELREPARGHRCEPVSNGYDLGSEYPDEARALRHLRIAPDSWTLLMELGSDEWTWGHAGALYFWIRNSDLARRRFDRI
jgi:uncharacterized protein YwqG